MIKIKVLCVGKIKENYLNEGISEYLKRLSGYCNIEIVEVKDEKITNNNSEEKIKEIETQRIIEKINDKDYVILLDIKGKQLDSVELSNKMEQLIDKGIGNFTFVIGGSLGITEKIKSRADYLLSFSKMTFTHQMMRLLILEQLYRSFKIMKNETYHK